MAAEIRPQPGPQEQFLTTKADIAIYGGAAGGGKSYAMLLECLRHISNPGFRGVIFRRTSPELFGEGGLWDESQTIFRAAGGQPNESKLRWKFPSGASISFSHMQYSKDKYAHQGRQYAFIGFDEITHFTEDQFDYLLSRNRSVCGVRPYIRATTNPDPDSFIRRMIDWYIGADGYPIYSRSGMIRYFVRVNDELIWSSDPEELERYGTPPISFTFIPARLSDNKILMDADPAYEATLNNLPLVERLRLSKGNWNARAAAGKIYKRDWFEVVDVAPAGLICCRGWDRAATEQSPKNPDPDYTAGVKVGYQTGTGLYYVMDVRRDRLGPHGVERMILNTAKQDGAGCSIAVFIDPGQAGKVENASTIKLLNSFNIISVPVQATKGKIVYTSPASRQAEAGNVKLVAGPWIEPFLAEFESFPDGKHDDMVDAFSAAYNTINSRIRTGVATAVRRRLPKHVM